MSPPDTLPPSIPTETRRRDFPGFLPIIALRPGRIACPHCDGTGFAGVSVPCSICRGRTTVPA